MASIQTLLERLRDAATLTPREFAQLFEEALLSDYGRTFEKVKTQKLLLKARSCAWIAQLNEHMERWLAGAPLKGKEKAQLKRHFNLCFTMQELLERIDYESSQLNIWKAATDDLLKALFTSIERRRLKDEQEIRERSAGTLENLRSGLQESEFDRRDLRFSCDYVERVVNQISRFGINKSADVSLTAEDLDRALALAYLADTVLHILDCYTYKSYRVSVDGKEIQLHALRSPRQDAEDWSALRQNQKHALDIYGLVREMVEARSKAEHLEEKSTSFAAFIETDNGTATLASSNNIRKQLIRILTRDVDELIDLDFSITTRSGTFTARELIDFWGALYQIAACASLWQRVSMIPDAPLLTRGRVVSLASSCLGWTPDQTARLLPQFVLDPSLRNQDPFFRPLVQLTDAHLLLACTFVETGRFSRNLFTIAIREGNVDFSPKGLKPLKDLRKCFIDAGYRCELNLPVVSSGQVITDVDLVASKDNVLFLGQTKVLIHPDTPYEDWKVSQSLLTASRQLRLCLEHLPFICDHFELAEGKFSVIPFLLTNVWDFTGAAIAGYKIVDFSYLSNLLNGGEIWEVDFKPEPRRRIRKLIKGRYPTGDELAELISKPLHEEMFRRALLEERKISVGEWTLILPVERVNEEAEKIRHATMTKLARY